MIQESANSQDSPKEKSETESILVMDLAALPVSHGIDVEKWMYLIKEHGVCFYDGASGNTPFYSKPNPNIKMYDVQEEKAMKELESILDEDAIAYNDDIPSPGYNIEREDGMADRPGTIGISGEALVFGTGGDILTTTGNIGLTPNMPSETLQVGGTVGSFISLQNVVSPDEAFSNEVVDTRGLLPRTEGSIEESMPQAGPLSDQEVEQLEVEDPRGEMAIGEGDSLSTDEVAFIDGTMNATQPLQLTSESNTRVRRSRASNNGPSFELTDDTI